MFTVTGIARKGNHIDEDRIFITADEALTAVNSAIINDILQYAEVRSLDTGEVIHKRGEK